MSSDAMASTAAAAANFATALIAVFISAPFLVMYVVFGCNRPLRKVRDLF